MLADIHGNLDALKAVLADARGLAIDQWWALGDLVLFDHGQRALAMPAQNLRAW